jgi:hypothetical protein
MRTKSKLGADDEVSREFDAMFEEHSGESSLDDEHEGSRDDLESSGLHVIPETTAGEFIGSSEHLFEHA